MSNVFPQFIPPVPEQSGHANLPGLTVPLDSAPYPEAEGGPDPATVALLKEDYAGAQGELTAILQYVFQSAASGDEAFSNAALQVAITEMMHLDMLGDAIETLGGSPRFDDGRYFWDASRVDYATDMRAMLAADIEAERSAIENYQRHMGLTENESVRALLARIIRDEQLHLQFFTDTLEALE